MTAAPALAPWLPYVEPSRAGSLLICCPHAGGSASVYRGWSTALAPDGIETWPVQLPGREGRFAEPMVTDADTVVDAVVERLLAHGRGRAYAIYGHSAGAFLAWRIAMAADRAAPGLVHLFLGASRSPSSPDPDFPIHQLPDDRFLGRIEQYGRLPAELLAHSDLLATALETTRADLRLVEDQRWPTRPLLNCPVTAFAGVLDAAVPRSSQHGWSEITTGTFIEVTLDGGHFPPPAAEVQILEAIRRALG